jgi:hypothetical protein
VCGCPGTPPSLWVPHAFVPSCVFARPCHALRKSLASRRGCAAPMGYADHTAHQGTPRPGLCLIAMAGPLPATFLDQFAIGARRHPQCCLTLVALAGDYSWATGERRPRNPAGRPSPFPLMRLLPGQNLVGWKCASLELGLLAINDCGAGASVRSVVKSLELNEHLATDCCCGTSPSEPAQALVVARRKGSGKPS